MDHNLADIFNFLQLSPTIATAGQPTELQLSSIKIAGYRSIVNLAPDTHKNALPNQKEIVESLGLEYIHIPVQFARPTIADFNHFCDVINSRQDRSIFVHCAANFRVSSFMYLYRRIYAGINVETAQVELTKIWMPNPIWQDFIDRTIVEKIK